MTANPILEVSALSVSLGRGGNATCAVRNVSFSIAPGEVLGLAGESGSGKSMTLMAILNLLPRGAERTVERIRFAGEPITNLSAREMRRLMAGGIATIFQNPMTALNPVLTIGAMLEEVYRTHRGGSGRAARDRAAEMLDRVAIPDAGARLAQYPHELSGGLRQRVMIAMALMCEPSVLFADEPTTALDVTVQKGILDLIDEIRREMGLAVVLVSHDLGVIHRIADRVAVMYGGQIIESGPVGQVLRHPAHPYSRALLRSSPSMSGPPGPLPTIPGTVQPIDDNLRGCAFRARCPDAAAICETDEPAPRAVGPGRLCRCHLSPSGEALP